ncbi:hypothetical protein ACFQZ1_13445 [Bacillus sp. CGMCC 1.60114]
MTNCDIRLSSRHGLRLHEKKEYRKRIDFSDKQAQRMWEYDEEKVST